MTYEKKEFLKYSVPHGNTVKTFGVSLVEVNRVMVA